MTAPPTRLLARSALLLLAFSLALYALAVQTILAQACKLVGPTMASYAIALVLISAGILAARALLLRSIAAWLAFAAMLALVVILRFATEMLSLPGCSGV